MFLISSKFFSNFNVHYKAPARRILYLDDSARARASSNTPIIKPARTLASNTQLREMAYNKSRLFLKSPQSSSSSTSTLQRCILVPRSNQLFILKPKIITSLIPNFLFTTKKTSLILSHIQGFYPATDFLGQGANGNVYRTTNLKTGSVYAAKRAKHLGKFEERCAREMGLLATEYRPFRELTVSGPTWFIMKFIPGRTLEDELSDTDSLFSVMDLYLTAKAKLALLHDAGLVHGDAHVGNIMVEAGTGDIHMIDFGNCRPIGVKSTGHDGVNEADDVESDFFLLALTFKFTLMHENRHVDTEELEFIKEEEGRYSSAIRPY